MSAWQLFLADVFLVMFNIVLQYPSAWFVFWVPKDERKMWGLCEMFVLCWRPRMLCQILTLWHCHSIDEIFLHDLNWSKLKQQQQPNKNPILCRPELQKSWTDCRHNSIQCLTSSNSHWTSFASKKRNLSLESILKSLDSKLRNANSRFSRLQPYPIKVCCPVPPSNNFPLTADAGLRPPWFPAVAAWTSPTKFWHSMLFEATRCAEVIGISLGFSMRCFWDIF